MKLRVLLMWRWLYVLCVANVYEYSFRQFMLDTMPVFVMCAPFLALLIQLRRIYGR